MLNILSGSQRDEISQLLKKRGYQILGKDQKESILINYNGKEHLGSLEAPFTVSRDGKKYVVMIDEGEATDPSVRRRLIEYDRFFGLSGVLLVNPREETVREVRLKFPRERGIDFYLQFIIALFIITFVIGIIWLMVQIRLF